jgi:CRISPR-associated protein (TIGR03984 family)
MERANLKIEKSTNLMLREVMEEKSRGSAAVFLLAYSPTRCAFANWDSKDEKIVSLDGKEIVDAYEIRAFGENFEIRWVKDASSGVWRATILQEEDGGEYSCLPGKYILWGTVKSVFENTAVLYEPRVGNVIVPKPGFSENIKPGSHVALSFKEYFKPDCKYGNLVFAAERLTGLDAL